jgi:branched-chain amino acid transport system ATP-binding protein
MTRPELMMLDEPSQGLAPKLVDEVFETIHTMKKDIGLTILVVEQNADASLNAADYVYVMHEGVIKAEGTPDDIKQSDDIREAYLGI